MTLRFEWDPRKALQNLAKHGVSFEVAITAFDDPHALFIEDAEHSEGELREKLLGATDDSGVLLVVFTGRAGSVTRIISAREATRREKTIYAENQTAD